MTYFLFGVLTGLILMGITTVPLLSFLRADRERLQDEVNAMDKQLLDFESRLSNGA